AEMGREHIDGLLLRGEKVEEQGGEARFSQRPRHEPIAGAVPAAAAAMGEKNHPPRPAGEVEIAFEGHTSCRDPDGLLSTLFYRSAHEPLQSSPLSWSLIQSDS